MRVLFALPPAPAVSGLSLVRIYVLRLAAALVRRGMSAYVLMPYNTEPSYPEVAGLKVIYWPDNDNPSLRAILREIRPHVVQVENRPELVPDIRQAFSGQLVLNLHHLWPLRRENISRDALRVALCLVDHIVLGSYYEKSLFLGRFFGLRCRTHVVYPGVDVEEFRPYTGDAVLQRERTQWRQRLGLAKQDFVVLAVGQSGAQSGIDIVLQAAKLANIRHLKVLLVNANLDDLSTTGYVNPSLAPALIAPPARLFDTANARDLPALYRVADAFVSPSLVRTSLGMVNLAAQASGLPLVTGLRGGIVEMVDHRWTLLLRKHGEASAWANALLTILRSERLQTEMAFRGREFAKGFGWEQSARGFLSLYSGFAPPRPFGSS